MLQPFTGNLTISRIADVLARRGRSEEYFLSSSIAFQESEKPAALAADYYRQMRDLTPFDVIKPYYQRLREVCPQADFLQQMTYIELSYRLPELLLMRADKMAMANSVEVRVPFLDHELVELALSMPASFKLRDGVPKEPLKRLAARFVPREEVYRPKKGFGSPIHEWFRSGLGEHFREVLTDPAAEAERYFNTDHLLRRAERGSRSTADAFRLWTVYNFLNWKRAVLDAPQAGVSGRLTYGEERSSVDGA